MCIGDTQTEMIGPRYGSGNKYSKQIGSCRLIKIYCQIWLTSKILGEWFSLIYISICEGNRINWTCKTCIWTKIQNHIRPFGPCVNDCLDLITAVLIVSLVRMKQGLMLMDHLITLEFLGTLFALPFIHECFRTC